jgi:gas vesicle protein
MYNRMDEQQTSSNSNAAGFLLGALTGALVGAGVALLFAPKTGKKMREDLMKQYEPIAQKVTSFASDAMSRASDVAGRVTDRASDLVGRATDRVSDVTDSAASTLHDAVDSGRSKVNHVMSQAQTTAQTAKARS